MDEIKILIFLQGGTLISIVTIGFKISRFLNRLEFQNNLMWADYKSRMRMARHDDVEITDNE